MRNSFHRGNTTEFRWRVKESGYGREDRTLEDNGWTSTPGTVRMSTTFPTLHYSKLSIKERPTTFHLFGVGTRCSLDVSKYSRPLQGILEESHNPIDLSWKSLRNSSENSLFFNSFSPHIQTTPCHFLFLSLTT